jgi:NAD(P)-dependent dehydrogenase (short-subunit alcohol dehydrogenase family)
MGTPIYSISHIQGTNVVGHFVFTKELLPLLLATAKKAPLKTRVIWTSSNGHSMAPKGIINFEDVNLANESGWVRYGQSKAVHISLTYELKPRQPFSLRPPWHTSFPMMVSEPFHSILEALKL